MKTIEIRKTNEKENFNVVQKTWRGHHIENIVTFVDHNSQSSSSRIEGFKKKNQPNKTFCSKCNNKIHWMLNLQIWNFKENTQCYWMNKKPWKVTIKFDIQQKSPIVVCVNCEQPNNKKTNQQKKNKMPKPSGTCQMHKTQCFQANMLWNSSSVAYKLL
jgi:hypothetical protein